MSEIINGIGLTKKSNPLISFHCLIDEDLSLIKYVLLNFRNETVFDLNKVINMTFFDIIRELYERKYKNPLEFLMKNDNDRSFLQECYNEFIRDHESEILEHATGTEIMRLIVDYKNSGDIIPYILYYTDAQKAILDSEKTLNNIKKLKYDKLVRGDYPEKAEDFSQYYFKYIDEIFDCKFENFSGKTFYFSTCSLNLNEDNSDIKDPEFAMNVIKNDSKMNLFDLYRMDIIRSKENGD